MNNSFLKLLTVRTSSISFAITLDFLNIDQQQIFRNEYFIFIFPIYLLFQLSELIIVKKIGGKSPNQYQLLNKLINSTFALIITILLNGNGQSMIGNMIIEFILIKKHYEQAFGILRKIIQIKPLVFIIILLTQILVSKQYRYLQSVAVLLFLWISLIRSFSKQECSKSQKNEMKQFKNSLKKPNIDQEQFSVRSFKLENRQDIRYGSISEQIGPQLYQKQKKYIRNPLFYVNQPKKTNQIDGKKLLNIIPFGCVILDSNSQLVYKNTKITEMLGTHNDEEFLKKISVIIKGSKLNGPETPEKRKIQQSLCNALQNNKRRSKSIQLVQKMLSSAHLSSLKGSVGSQISQKIKPMMFSYSFIYNNKIVHLKIKIHNGQLCYAEKEIMLHKDQIIRERSKSMENYEDNFIFIEIKNVSKKKDLKKMYNKHKFQNRLLESFSHELRTPLNGSISGIQILLQETALKNYEKLLQQVFGSNLLLLHQINDILDSAAIENNNFQYNFQTFSMQEIVSEIKQIYTECMKIKLLNFIVIINDQINLQIKSDKSRILQILINLLNNAIKFTEEGGTIQLIIESVIEDLINFFKVTVKDDGVGISLEKKLQLKKTVELSARTKLKDSDKDECFIGLGIGICAKLSQGLRDSDESNLRIQSFIHGETTFSFLIQNQNSQQHSLVNSDHFCNDSDFSQEFKKSFSKRKFQIPHLSLCFDKQKYSTKNIEIIDLHAKNNKCRCINVLVVDDVPFNHIALKYLFESCNLLIEQSFDGFQAINKVKQKLKEHCPAYSLILMDIEMPSMDGYQCSIQIKELLKKENLNSHIMMCSAYDSQNNVERAFQSGMDGCLQKPVRKQTLLNLLTELKLIQ